MDIGTIIVILIFVVPLLIAAGIKKMHDGNPDTIDEQVKRELETSEKEPYSYTERSKYQNRNWKRMYIFAVIFALGILLVIIPSIGRDIANMGKYLVFGFGMYGVVLVILYVLTMKNVSKIADDKPVYVIKCFVKEIVEYEGDYTAFYIYYDYLKRQHIVKSKRLNHMEVHNRNRYRNMFDELIVMEDGNRLKVVSFRVD